MPRKKRVRFVAVQTVNVPVRVRFVTRDGQYVSFTGTKVQRKRRKVSFLAKK